MAGFRGTVETTALIQRGDMVSWLRRLYARLKGVYRTLTCNRASDVEPYRGPQRPPRPSRPPQVTPQHPSSQFESHGGPRPRYTPQPSPRPPPPDQAGGSTWQQPMSQFDTGGSTWEQDTSRFDPGRSSWDMQSTPLNPNMQFRPQQYLTHIGLGMLLSILIHINYRTCASL